MWVGPHRAFQSMTPIFMADLPLRALPSFESKSSQACSDRIHTTHQYKLISVAHFQDPICPKFLPHLVLDLN